MSAMASGAGWCCTAGHGVEAVSGSGAICVSLTNEGAWAGVRLTPAVMAMSAAELAGRIVQLNTLAYMRFQLAQHAEGNGTAGQWVASPSQVEVFAALLGARQT